MKLDEFLRRNPWCSDPVLSALFKMEDLNDLLRKKKIVSRPSTWGTLYACPNEDVSSALNLYRLESARQFAMMQWGPNVVLSGISPSPTSNGRFSVQGHIWDLFVDPGSITPEGLDFVRRPPFVGNESFRLILASHPDRVAPLVRCVQKYWIGSETFVGVSPLSPFSDGVALSSLPPMERVIPNAHNLAASKKGLDVPMEIQRKYAEYLIEGGPGMVYRLALAGNCPLLSLEELSLLDKDATSLSSWQNLDKGGWFIGDERKVLSPKAIALLGMVWGASAADLLKYHPWPLMEKDGMLEYQVLATAWHAEHLRLVRQMTLGFIDGARRCKSADRPIDVRLESLVSSRLGGVAPIDIGKETAPKIADSFLRVFLPVQKSGKATFKVWDVLLGVDRGTFLLNDQESRIIQQQDIWQEEMGRLVTQVWIFADPAREETMLGSMQRRATIPIWSTTLQRLRLDADNPYWSKNPPSVFPFASINGAAPWRPIWRYAGPAGLGPDSSGVVSLFGFETA